MGTWAEGAPRVRENMSERVRARDAINAMAAMQAEQQRRWMLHERHAEERGEGAKRVREAEAETEAAAAVAKANKRRRAADEAARRATERADAAEEKLAAQAAAFEASKRAAAAAEASLAAAEASLAAERKARAAVEKRYATRVEVASETLATLKGAQSELADARRSEEAAQLELETTRAQVGELSADVEWLRGAVEVLEAERTDLTSQLKLLMPLPSRKPIDQLGKAMTNRRGQEARARLAVALEQPDLRIADVAKTLASTGLISAVYDKTRVSAVPALGSVIRTQASARVPPPPHLIPPHPAPSREPTACPSGSHASPATNPRPPTPTGGLGRKDEVCGRPLVNHRPRVGR